MKTPWLVNKRWTSANLRWSDKRKKNIPGGRRQILAGGERWTNVGNFPPLEFLGLLLGEAASQPASSCWVLTHINTRLIFRTMSIPYIHLH